MRSLDLDKLQECTFYVGQKVWLTVPGYNSQKGPYWIESSLGQGVYTLCDKDGYPATEYGEVVKEENLKEFES